MQAISNPTLIRPADQKLTIELLTTTRWSFGPKGHAPTTSTFFFTPHGRFEGYRHPNENSWRLENDVLTIYAASGATTWRFHRAEASESIVLIGKYEPDQHIPRHVLTAFSPEKRFLRASPLIKHETAGLQSNENVRLVIWDLDDTFWSGTLSEGEVVAPGHNIKVVRTLTSRGILNSICSKNNFAPVKAKLTELGVWEYFVFPRIEFIPKGQLIKEIITASGLRTESILFLDDNASNLNEALHDNPGLQISLPSLLPSILSDGRFQGKPDPGHNRLQRYKLLEDKLADREMHAGANRDFLLQSDIRISFHFDIVENFGRIHELVNRTHQLNFTKTRWPEDEAEARKAYLTEMVQDFHSQSGYVKVSDQYGSYGICGFYLIHHGVAKHFLFSCRSMNMGVEQFVWKKLHRPQVNASGEVVSDIGAPVDWITVVEDADLRQGPPPLTADRQGAPFTICIRGACDLELAAHYLQNDGRLLLEYPYPFQGWAISQSARAAVASLEASSPGNQALLAKLPGMPTNRFRTSIADGGADMYVISFSQEPFQSLYRCRSTGLVLPLQFDVLSATDITSVDYETLVALSKDTAITESQWNFLRSELEYVGQFDERLFKSDLMKIFILLTLVKQKMVVILSLNDSVGQNKWVLEKFGQVNKVVRAATAEWNRANDRKVHTIELDDIVRSEDDLTEERGGPHFTRGAYSKMAQRISALAKSSAHPRGFAS